MPDYPARRRKPPCFAVTSAVAGGRCWRSRFSVAWRSPGRGGGALFFLSACSRGRARHARVFESLIPRHARGRPRVRSPGAGRTAQRRGRVLTGSASRSALDDAHVPAAGAPALDVAEAVVEGARLAVPDPALAQLEGRLGPVAAVARAAEATTVALMATRSVAFTATPTKLQGKRLRSSSRPRISWVRTVPSGRPRRFAISLQLWLPSRCSSSTSA